MITLSIHPDLPSAAARRSLASWLRAEERLRELVTTTSPEGESAGHPDVLRVAAGDAGTAMVLIQAVAAWLTHRREDVTVTLTRPGGWSAEVDIHRARDMDQVTALIEAAVRAVTAPQS
ncbi:hypothetical protein AB0A73_15575 [Glycomyces sp. NPDC047369]|uniref:effector-associated constant component EACC1 n=1 Tax=Micromonospora TaxID=1873 RepID=UPI001FFD3809|nr:MULTISPECIES: hypothetical protein [unclassified Micromonospora]